MKELTTLQEVQAISISSDREFFSANHSEIKAGLTSDIYFIKTLEILKNLGLNEEQVTAEIFARKEGVLAGIPEALALLKDKGLKIWSLQEGEEFSAKEVIMRISGTYKDFCIFETALLGILASSSGWATAARQAKLAAEDAPVLCFGARHVHPAVAPVMERAALVGGADSASCILGAKLMGQEPSGTVPHAVFLIVGDTVKVAEAYHQYMPAGEKRLVLVDTFKDEAEETLRVASALGKDLYGIRLDTPSERGGVTPELVKEIRARLDMAGFSHIKIFVSGGLNPERIIALKNSGADAFGVGSFISGASAIDMTMDIKEIAGTPVAKRGRIPGVTINNRLMKIDI